MEEEAGGGGFSRDWWEGKGSDTPGVGMGMGVEGEVYVSSRLGVGEQGARKRQVLSS